MDDQEIKQLLLDNKASLERVDKIVKKIHKRMIWSALGGILKVVLIVAPLIFGVVYLSPFVKKNMGIIQTAFEILNNKNDQGVDKQIELSAGKIDIQQICDPKTQEMIEKMCK